MIEGYLTVNSVAEKWNLTPRRVRAMCANGLIDGATKVGREWVIPVDSSRPKDGRVTSGQYINWRNQGEVL